MQDDLPTIEECREFLRLVNVGRKAMGLDALEYLDYDACTPGDSNTCLSATHLFDPAGFAVGPSILMGKGNPAVIQAIGCERRCDDKVKIPAAIRKITDPFDSRFEESPHAPDPLRDRMVEAGVVRP